MRCRALVGAAMALLAGCGGGSDPPVQAAGGLDAAALAGEAATVDGGTVSLGDYADRDLVVWFWAPW